LLPKTPKPHMIINNKLWLRVIGGKTKKKEQLTLKSNLSQFISLLLFFKSRTKFWLESFRFKWKIL